MDRRREGDRPRQGNRPTETRSRRQKDNPFDDYNHLQSLPSLSSDAHPRDLEAGFPSTSRAARSNSRSIIMAQGAFSKGLDHFKQKELSQGNASANGELFQHLIAPFDRIGQNSSSASSPDEKESPVTPSSQDPSMFSPRLHGFTRNQLLDSHSRGLSGSTNDFDSFGMESTYDDGFHTANEIQNSQQNRGGTPPNASATHNDYYYQSPSYSMRGDTRMPSPASAQQSSTAQQPPPHGIHQTPVLIAKGPGRNEAVQNFGGSSTLSFTNTMPYSGVQALSNNADQLGALSDTKADTLSSKKHKKKKEKKSKFSPNPTAVSAISENKFYSGLSDMHTGLFLSTYNGQRQSVVPPKFAKSSRFPSELPPRPAAREPLPVRVTAEARAQFAARKQDQRLALERRLAEPHLVRRSLPASDRWGFDGASFKRLTLNCWVLIGITQFGFLSTAVCLGVVIAIKNTSKVISVPIIWWLILSVLILCVGAATFAVVFVRETKQHRRHGFRRRVGSREIIDGNLGRRGDLESGFNDPRSFEMVSGSHVPHREAFSAFSSSASNTYTEVLRPNKGRFEQGPVDRHGFEQVPLRGAREGPYYEPRMHNPEVGNTGFAAATPATPLTPLPQAVLRPITPRRINDFPTYNCNQRKPSVLHNANVPSLDVPETPSAIPTRTSARSRESMIAAAPHRDQAMKSLLGESPAPKIPLDITDIYNGDRVTIESAALSQTSVYSHTAPSPHPLHQAPAGLQHLQAADTFVSSSPSVSGMGSRIDLDMAIPPTLKRVETEGPLEKLERSFSHQSQQIATGQQVPSPFNLGMRPPKILHKRIVDGLVKQYGSQDDDYEVGPAVTSSGSNGPRRRPDAIGYREVPQATNYMNTEKSSALDNVDLNEPYDSTFASRNPYRDSMNDNGDNRYANLETLPSTYYTGSGKGKGRAYD
ncbi:hypothetical protein SBOR_2185 [Sclerotinia borealis F-4128]|uniref:Uncharacterized protein n=1 Tax=Sclerotinia borealis (strain F-4128) TaxID=1432307 RepID=W9CNS4_SCLBF|nr:hypothetical protein SBOR_2185 [Sclerotinia borealis F-4128]